MLMWPRVKLRSSMLLCCSDEKCGKCAQAGASFVVNYKTENFSEVVLEQTHGKGVAVILDCVGGPYLGPDLNCLALDGKIVFIGMQLGELQAACTQNSLPQNLLSNPPTSSSVGSDPLPVPQGVVT